MRLLFFVLLVVVECTQAAGLPPNALEYLPVLKAEQQKGWPTLAFPDYLAGQVEQETCPSLKSKRCWNPKTENINPKNNGEYGFGLSQITKTNKFNTFEELKAKYPDMKSWKWEDRYNPEYQLRGLIHMDKKVFDYFKVGDKMQFALSAYNRGLGNLLQDRKFCAQLPDCDPDKWWGNVEIHSHRPIMKLKGYGLSGHEINRDYVRNIEVRRVKYRPYLK